MIPTDAGDRPDRYPATQGRVMSRRIKRSNACQSIRPDMLADKGWYLFKTGKKKEAATTSQPLDFAGRGERI